MENQELLNLLQRMTYFQEKILEQLMQSAVPEIKAETESISRQDLLDNTDLKSILKISSSTLYRMRKNNQIQPIIIGKRAYYRLSECLYLKKQSPP